VSSQCKSFQHLATSLAVFGSFWQHLALFGIIWQQVCKNLATNLATFGNKCGNIWQQLATFVNI
jgi:hypothetical protein